MATTTQNATPKDKFLTNHKLLTAVFMGALLALALTFSMASAYAAPPIPPQPTPPPTPTPTPTPIPQHGVNIDVPVNIDPICGFEIMVISSVKPENFYNGPFNPWGAPQIVNEPVGSNRWKLVFGNPDGSGPCFPKDHFVRKDQFGHITGWMLHFGFYVSDPVINFDFACWFIAPGGAYVRCQAPITGHTMDRNRWAVNVINVLDHELAVENARWVLVDTPVAINDLMPTLTEHGTPLWLENNIIPAAQGGQPGILSIDLPAELQGQHGHLVMSYDVRDVANPEQFSTVTLAAPLQ